MKNSIFFRSLITTLLIIFVLFPSCKKDNTKSPAELYAEEMDILERFKETETYKSWFDSAEMVIDSSDAASQYKGLVYFQFEKGWGDTVQLGKRVGIRYDMYYILDSVGAKEPYLVKVLSNVTDANPRVYQVGSPDPYSGVYVGLDYGIRWMHCYGKSRMLFPSTLGGNDYVSRVMDVHITYMSK